MSALDKMLRRKSGGSGFGGRARPAAVYGSVLEHPDFPVIRDYLTISTQGKTRLRIGLQSDTPNEILQLALSLRVTCCACENVIAPFRARTGPKKRGDPHRNVYFSVSCPDSVNRGCCRGNKAKFAIEKFEAAIIAWLEEADE